MRMVQDELSTSMLLLKERFAKRTKRGPCPQDLRDMVASAYSSGASIPELSKIIRRPIKRIQSWVGSTSPVEKVRRLEVVASVDAQSRDRSLKIMFPSGAYVSITTESELEDPLLADLLFREAGRR